MGQLFGTSVWGRLGPCVWFGTMAWDPMFRPGTIKPGDPYSCLMGIWDVWGPRVFGTQFGTMGVWDQVCGFCNHCLDHEYLGPPRTSAWDHAFTVWAVWDHGCLGPTVWDHGCVSGTRCLATFTISLGLIMIWDHASLGPAVWDRLGLWATVWDHACLPFGPSFGTMNAWDNHACLGTLFGLGPTVWATVWDYGCLSAAWHRLELCGPWATVWDHGCLGPPHARFGPQWDQAGELCGTSCLGVWDHRVGVWECFGQPAIGWVSCWVFGTMCLGGWVACVFGTNVWTMGARLGVWNPCHGFGVFWDHGQPGPVFGTGPCLGPSFGRVPTKAFRLGLGVFGTMVGCLGRWEDHACLGPTVWGRAFGTMADLFGTTVSDEWVFGTSCLGGPLDQMLFGTRGVRVLGTCVCCVGPACLGPWVFGTTVWDHTVWDHRLGPHRFGPWVFRSVWDHGLGPSFGTWVFGTHRAFGTMGVWDQLFGTMGVPDQLFGTIPFGTIVWDHACLGPPFGTMFGTNRLGPPFGTRVFGTHNLGPCVFGTMVWDHRLGLWVFDHRLGPCACLGTLFGTTFWDYGCLGPTVWGRAFGTMGVWDQLFGTMGVRDQPAVWDHRVWDLGPGVGDQLAGTTVWDYGCLGPPFGTMGVGCLGPVWDHGGFGPAVWDCVWDHRLGPQVFWTMGVWGLGPWVFGTNLDHCVGIMGVGDQPSGTMFGTTVWDHGCLGPLFGHGCFGPSASQTRILGTEKMRTNFQIRPSYLNDSTLKQSGCDNTEKEE